MPQVKLHRRYIFEHLQGKPLSKIFSGAGLRVFGEDTEQALEPVLFVHGRAESIRGDTTINSIVLAHSVEQIDLRKFVGQVPKIYQDFSKTI